MFVFISGINRNNKQNVKYPDVPSVTKPVPHDPGFPIPEHTGKTNKIKCSSSAESEDSKQDPWNAEQSTGEPKLLTQFQLNNLTRDLNMIKGFAQLLGSQLRERNLLARRTLYFWYRHWDEGFKKHFR